MTTRHTPLALYDANTSEGRANAAHLLGQHGLAVGTLVLLEERTRQELRTFCGEVTHAYALTNGECRLVFRGRTGWAPAGGVAALDATPTGLWGTRLVRRLTGLERAAVGSGAGLWATANHPLNSRQQVAA